MNNDASFFYYLVKRFQIFFFSNIFFEFWLLRPLSLWPRFDTLALFLKGPKCLLLGDEVFCEWRNRLCEGPKYIDQRPKCLFEKGRSGLGRSGSSRSVQTPIHIASILSIRISIILGCSIKMYFNILSW